MGSSMLKATLLKAGIAAGVLFLANGLAMAQSAVTLTAGPQIATLPDGQAVPMWGYTCGASALDNGSVSARVSCTAANGAAQTPGVWQPPRITVPSGQDLVITLNNSLAFGANTVPTSLVIVGQLGGGLGTTAVTVASPTHAVQGTTWPGTPGGTGTLDPVFTPPAQAARVRSFATEVAAGGSAVLTWTAANLRPGTYLIHSGTQPSIQHPMGLYGVLVVTDPLATPTVPQAYGQTFDKDLALLLSEIDPVQNAAVDQAVRTTGFDPALVWNGQTGECGNPAVHTCYPPAVNYQPLYYLINGKSFDRSNAAASALTVPAVAAQGRVLLRYVNAGLRMHVPSVVGANVTLLAEDGNKLPGVPKKQSSLFLAAGKTYDVTIQPTQTSGGTYAAATYPVFDRALGLSTNNQPDGGMQAFINVAGGAAPASTIATANADSYFVTPGNTLTVSDPAKGLIANDVGIYGVAVQGPAIAGLTLNSNGTFSYTGPATSFNYCGNGAIAGLACNMVTLAACTLGNGCLGGAPTANADTYTSPIATRLQISPPGLLANDTDPTGLPLKVDVTSVVTVTAGLAVSVNPDGSFTATATSPGPKTFTYRAKNSQNTLSAVSGATVTVNFPTPSNLAVAVKDAKSGAAITDYRWIIEEDRTIFIDPTIESAGSSVPVRNVAINFHTSHTPVVAQGCVGTVSCEAGQTLLGAPAVCDVGNGACRTTAAQRTAVLPGQVALDPTKRYYLSILPGDGADPVSFDPPRDGHTMGGAQIAAGQTAVEVNLQRTPLAPAKIAIFVFQDDNPLNGEHDGGGPITTVAQKEKGLGGFNIVLLDQAGNRGDSTGQLTYDMFGMPVSNALAGKIDPNTGLDACPISKTSTDGLVGVIVTCPTYESDGVTESPLAGHAIVDNMYAGFYEAVITPGAARSARGEEWLQTNTLDGTKAIEAFIKPGEPAYFQEFGPGGFHIAMGFANPAIINARKGTNGDGLGKVCSNQACTATINGQVTGLRMSRTPDQRVYSSGNYDVYSFTQCYASLGAPDSEDFAFAKCDPKGKFTFSGLPEGNYKVTVFDQWNDLLVDGLSTPVAAATTNADGSLNGNCTGAGATLVCNYEIAVTQWRTNLYGRIFLDLGNCGSGTADDPLGIAGDGVSQPCESGLPLAPYNIRFRDGSYAGYNNTDLAGYAGFNEVFPYLNWLVVDIDNARHKLTGIHVVYDAGGQVDNPACAGTGCGNSTIAANIANTRESPTAHLPADLRVPGARYCTDADCTVTGSFVPGTGTTPGSTGRVDPGWVGSEGWQGLLGNNNIIEFAMKPFMAGENGGIKGHVLYTPTRPFDDPALLLQLSWAPGVPNVKVNLYQQGTALDGTKTLKLVDTTTSSSWDDWAQGFRKDPLTGLNVLGTDGKPIPNMSCPGQETSSPFYYTLENSAQALDPLTPLSQNSRFKCFDGWAMLSQVQPAPYNGLYRFPSIRGRNPTTGAPAGTFVETGTAGTRPGSNCTICTPNPDDGTPMLPAGKYVVEVIVPQGYELVKEEDKNILLGDAYIAPAVQQFAGFGNIFIMPDQAAINAFYNPSNTLQRTTNNGAVPRREGDTGSIEVFWPCVGATRIVPDLNSLYPGAGQAAPFAGASRPLCDRKEITLNEQMTALAKFYIFSSTHVAGHYTGTITNDFASEFDPFSPQFGEKFAVPNTPVGIRDFAGKEVSRVYADQWGIYNGMNFSSYTVNPPSPSGYIPQMMIACMNDPGPILDTRTLVNGTPNPTLGQMITDPAYNPAYSNFCYEIPFMPGQTQYLDTPVIPTMAFAAGYNLPDCEYPDATPAIKSVHGPSNGGAGGPYVSASGQTLTITSLGKKQVLNHAYSGPRATTAPYNKKYITRDYGFAAAAGTVTIGGVNAPVTGWTDTTITVTVPATVPLCNTTSSSYLGPNATARCGELVITTALGKKSIDAVTVTIGGTAPIYVTPTSASSTLFDRIVPSPLQSAIDSAAPGSLIIVGAGSYNENLLMWKPLRLQGVGAASVTINADAHPAGKLDAWRRQVNCLFGLTLEGRPAGAAYPGCPAEQFNKVDRNDSEGIIGWDATTNGNVAQQLQEPTLMGSYEGAGVTTIGKGVKYPAGADPYQLANAGVFPPGTLYLNGNSGTGTADCTNGTSGGFDTFDHATSNYRCNPARIDGVSIINSSQGGGGIFVHGWGHNLEIANNRVYANHGTLSGGIVVGSPEFGAPYLVGGVDPIPFPVPPLTPTGTQLGYGKSTNVRVHHNAVTSNASIGDALFSGVNSAAGGVSFCTGSDSYKFNNNWVCGNLSTGDGGGVAHLGFSNDGDISNNWIIFNQTASPTLPTNGGGLAILGASPDRILADGTECGTVTDADCPPGLAEGTGRNLVVNANLIMGNSAESGTGGGLRLQLVNGQEVVAFPRLPNPTLLLSPGWNSVTVTNNIIANNVAGWDGGGVSLQDALNVKFINNTVISNDTTASAGVLFNTLGAPFASVPPPGCSPASAPTATCPRTITTSTYQAAGLVTMRNTSNMDAAIAALTPVLGVTVRCPNGAGYGTDGLLGVDNGSCRQVSLPLLTNNVFWKNRAFRIDVGLLGTDQQNQQRVVTLVPSLNQTSTGFCAAAGTDVVPGTTEDSGPTNYWDIGVRGDTGPANHGNPGGYRLVPRFSILTQTTDYTGLNNLLGSDPAVVRQYCNGSRLPPEGGGLFSGFNVPPGRSETTGLYPVFALNQITPAATVDEGNNWINLSYGPLSLTNPATLPATVNYGVPLADYSIGAGSPAINAVPNSGAGAAAFALAPATDFFGAPRKANGAVDMGAVEFAGVAGPAANVAPASLAFGSVVVGNTSASQTLTLNNYGTVSLTITSVTVTAPFSRNGGTCAATLLAGANCTIFVRFQPTAASTSTGTVTIAGSFAVTGSPVGLTGTGIAAPTRPTLAVLDNFNRANANTLGANWAQLVVAANAAIRVNTNQASCPAILCPLGGNAEWNPASFGAKQGAAFTIANTTVNNDALILAGTGTQTGGVSANHIRVLYNAGTVSIQTTTNTGLAYTTVGTLASAFVNGDTITAVLDGTTAVAAPTVYVWRTTAAAVTTFVGEVQIPPNSLWQGGGRIGMRLPPAGLSGARVDNFAGGTVP